MKKVKPIIIPPDNGWQERTWYLVDVSYREGNPIHRSLFYTGFLDKGHPGGYNGLVPLNGPDHEAYASIHQIRYLKAIRLLISEKEARL